MHTLTYNSAPVDDIQNFDVAIDLTIELNGTIILGGFTACSPNNVLAHLNGGFVDRGVLVLEEFDPDTIDARVVDLIEGCKHLRGLTDQLAYLNTYFEWAAV